MKKILPFIFVVLISSCTANKKNKTESAIETFGKDSIMQSIMYSNIDTINGHWRIKISKEEAIQNGVPEEIYAIFENSMKEVNSHIDRIKKANPKASIGYNFPNIKK